MTGLLAVSSAIGAGCYDKSTFERQPEDDDLVSAMRLVNQNATAFLAMAVDATTEYVEGDFDRDDYLIRLALVRQVAVRDGFFENVVRLRKAIDKLGPVPN